MTNEELLLEMSNIMQVQLQPVRQQLDNLDQHMDGLENYIKSDMAPRLKRVEADVGTLNIRVGNLEKEMGDLKSEVGDLRLTAENQIVPSLTDLSSCYVDTYVRYSKWADRIEGMDQEMGILKRVVSEHSKKLENLS